MTSLNPTTTFSGHTNRGFQLGSSSGNVHVSIHGQPEESLTKLNPSSTVPFRRDHDFVDRDILAEVGKKCSIPASRTALVGLGGVGKSQIAIEYSYRVREESPQTWIFWVHGSNAARFEEGYRMVADRIKLPRRDEPTTDILQLVNNWLCDEANGQWIIILDNADDPSVFLDPCKGRLKPNIGEVSLASFLPQTQNGSILVTSRNKDAASKLTGSHHDIIMVEPMDESHALLLLGKKLQAEFDKNDAVDLLRALDYMPLAISQAAAYISRRAPWATVARYLDDFRKSDRNRANLLDRDAGDLRRDRTASNSIITTWQISFEYISTKRPSAARLLSLMSLFDRQGIPKFLLHYYDDKEDNSSIDLIDNDDMDLKSGRNEEFEEDVFTLTSFSLITTNANIDQFEMHRLVQFSTRKWLELNREMEKWEKKYIRIISEAFPSGEYENWMVCKDLFPHVEAMLAYRPVERKYLVFWSEVLQKAGQYVLEQGSYLKAEKISRQALDGREKALGKEHLDTLTSLSDLALVLKYQGKYEKAEEINRQALEKREKTLGNEHLHTLMSVSNLASVLQEQGEYEAAEEMNRRALVEREKLLGMEHPNTLTSVNDLASVLQDQGKDKAAEKLYCRALEGREKALGKDHPDTLSSVNNLASALRGKGNYEAAEEMYRRALEGKEKALGKEHPSTLTSINSLALVLCDRGNYEAAEEMSRRALNGKEKALGKEHPSTLASINNLAWVLQNQGKYKAAEEMYCRALEGTEKTLGMEHPSTLINVNNLSTVLQDQGRYRAAEEMYRRALEGREKVLGKDHPDTLRSVGSLASVLQDQEKYKAAEEMYRRALEGREKALGRDHSDTLKSVKNLATVLQDQGRYKAAEEMYCQALEGREKVLGKDYPSTLISVNNLATVLQNQGKYKTAEEMYCQALEGREKVLGKDHPDTLTSVGSLASVLQDQEKDKTSALLTGRRANERETGKGFAQKLLSSLTRRRLRINSKPNS